MIEKIFATIFVLTLLVVLGLPALDMVTGGKHGWLNRCTDFSARIGVPTLTAVMILSAVAMVLWGIWHA